MSSFDFNNISSDLINEEVIFLSEDATLPTRGTEDAACKDLYSPIDCTIPPHSNMLIKTDVALAWDNRNYYVQLLSRSGLTYKYNVVVQCGTIDRDYRKNIGVLLQNNSDIPFEVKKGDRIAQYAYLKIATVKSNVVSEFTPLDSNSDRTGGFGSTGR